MKVRFNQERKMWEAYRRAPRTVNDSVGHPRHKPEVEVVVEAGDMATFREKLIDHLLRPYFERAQEEVDAAIDAAYREQPRPN
jgi:hypothetical protein